MINVRRVTPTLDKWAVSASTICAIHCLTLPLLLGVFPALSTSIFGQEMFHQLLLWLVIPLSMFSLTLGCRIHKSLFVAGFGITGILILVLAATIGHDGLGEIAERIATLIGASAIATAHVKNYLLCRKHDCDHSQTEI